MLKLQTVQARERDLLWIIDQKYLNETTTYYDDPMDLIDGYPKPEIAYIGFSGQKMVLGLSLRLM